MYWINGVLRKKISLTNRALHFGDGFFTTAKFKNGKIDFLNWHMDRLVYSARRLMFKNINFNLLYKEMLYAVHQKNTGIIKVIISRSNDKTNNTYGYQYQHDSEPTRIIYISQLSDRYIKWHQSGIRLKRSMIRLSRNSFLGGIKHLNRLEQVMISTWMHSNKGFDEALVLDTDGNVVECCSANIFWRKDNCVFTPSVFFSGVNGVIRQLVLKLLPKLGYKVQEVIVGPEHLRDADEVFITNSLLPIASVCVIDNFHYSNKILFYLLSSHIFNTSLK